MCCLVWGHVVVLLSQRCWCALMKHSVACLLLDLDVVFCAGDRDQIPDGSCWLLWHVDLNWSFSICHHYHPHSLPASSRPDSFLNWVTSRNADNGRLIDFFCRIHWCQCSVGCFWHGYWFQIPPAHWRGCRDCNSDARPTQGLTGQRQGLKGGARSGWGFQYAPE